MDAGRVRRPLCGLKGFSDLLLFLHIFLEPLSNILTCLTDQARFLVGSLMQWFQIHVFERYGPEVPFRRKWRVNSRDLKTGRFLGQGCSGILYETKWSGRESPDLLARKYFPEVESDVFENEAARLVELGDHPNTVKSLCWTIDKRSCSLVMEYMRYDLYSVVQKRKEAQRKEAGSGDPIPPFQLLCAINIIFEMATGMKYLHDQGIAHGDLKPNNVLVSTEADPMLVKVTDFGLDETKRRSTTLISNRARCLQFVRWKAPELFKDYFSFLSRDSEDIWRHSLTELDVKFSGGSSSDTVLREARMKMADIYSFALTCLYTLGGQCWDPNLSLTELRIGILHGSRPQIPSGCPTLLVDLISSCWDDDPLERPTFKRICQVLQVVKSEQEQQIEGIGPNSSVQHTLTNSLERIYNIQEQEPTTLDRSNVHSPSQAKGVNLMHDQGEPTDIGALPSELLYHVFRRLPLRDSIRAQAVSRRWRDDMRGVQYCDVRTAQSYCPLIFDLCEEGLQHSWCGYDSISGKWEPLPSLLSLPPVHVLPIAGNGRRLLGFKLFTEFSGIVVVNPYSGEWKRIPKCRDNWGDAGRFLLADSNHPDEFRIISILEDDPDEIYNSVQGKWRPSPSKGLHDKTSLARSIRTQHCAILCGSFLYCYCTTFLTSFDVHKEEWTDDRISLPDHNFTPRSFQLVECEGNLFAAIDANSTITIWGLGTENRKFSPIVVMPMDLYSVLRGVYKPGALKAHPLKGVGHGNRIFIWKHQQFKIIMFDIAKRTWDILPDFKRTLDVRERTDRQIFVYNGSFEP